MERGREAGKEDSEKKRLGGKTVSRSKMLDVETGRRDERSACGSSVFV